MVPSGPAVAQPAGMLEAGWPDPRPELHLTSTLTQPVSAVAEAADRRRTFAIISHPDAGKTTLTEKLLLMGGAIHLAGEVRAKGERRRARSDWMKIEQARGISVTTSVMTFDYAGCTFNLLDTPGHEDFSEDTYRTLTAVDSAVMVLDAAKGIEPQTLKLFEVCRLRDVPIMTFINKMDREARDPIELLDEVADRLALDVAPMNWPIGMGRNFRGVQDLRSDAIILLDPEREGAQEEVVPDRRSNSLRGSRPRRRARGARPDARARHRRAARLLARGLSRRPSDPGLLRQRAQELRRAGAARRAGRAGAEPAAAADHDAGPSIRARSG